jgi:hypothetical protein
VVALADPDLALSLLAGRAQDGDAAALAQLGPHVLTLAGEAASAVCRRCPRPLARRLREECESAAWPVAMRALRLYQPGRPFSRYLRGALYLHFRSRVLRPALYGNAVRRAQRFTDVSARDDWWHDLVDNRASDAVSAEQPYTDLAGEVRKILRKMSPAQAKLLKIVYGITDGDEGLPEEPVRVRDLERQQGAKRGTIHMRVARARLAFARLATAAGLDR